MDISLGKARQLGFQNVFVAFVLNIGAEACKRAVHAFEEFFFEIVKGIQQTSFITKRHQIKHKAYLLKNFI